MAGLRFKGVHVRGGGRTGAAHHPPLLTILLLLLLADPSLPLTVIEYEEWGKPTADPVS